MNNPKWELYKTKAKTHSPQKHLTTKRRVVSPVYLSLATIRATCGKESVSTTTQWTATLVLTFPFEGQLGVHHNKTNTIDKQPIATPAIKQQHLQIQQI